jgi:hypothetical protein
MDIVADPERDLLYTLFENSDIEVRIVSYRLWFCIQESLQLLTT